MISMLLIMVVATGTIVSIVRERLSIVAPVQPREVLYASCLAPIAARFWYSTPQAIQNPRP